MAKIDQSKGIYQFEAADASGNTVSMEEYRGKVLLIVNTATGCRFTKQYKGLEMLYRKYHAQGFEILDFPCNQFGFQAPGKGEDIVRFCKMNYSISFRIFDKVKVNGIFAHPLYKYLKKQKKGKVFRKIGWNFTKFLVDRDGNVLKRYRPDVEPEQIEEDIKACL